MDVHVHVTSTHVGCTSPSQQVQHAASSPITQMRVQFSRGSGYSIGGRRRDTGRILWCAPLSFISKYIRSGDTCVSRHVRVHAHIRHYVATWHRVYPSARKVK